MSSQFFDVKELRGTTAERCSMLCTSALSSIASGNPFTSSAQYLIESTLNIKNDIEYQKVKIDPMSVPLYWYNKKKCTATEALLVGMGVMACAKGLIPDTILPRDKKACWGTVARRIVLRFLLSLEAQVIAKYTSCVIERDPTFGPSIDILRSSIEEHEAPVFVAAHKHRKDVETDGFYEMSDKLHETLLSAAREPTVVRMMSLLKFDPFETASGRNALRELMGINFPLSRAAPAVKPTP